MTPLASKNAEAYCQHIQELVLQLKKKSKAAVAENAKYLVVPEEAAKMGRTPCGYCYLKTK